MDALSKSSDFSLPLVSLQSSSPFLVNVYQSRPGGARDYFDPFSPLFHLSTPQSSFTSLLDTTVACLPCNSFIGLSLGDSSSLTRSPLPRNPFLFLSSFLYSLSSFNPPHLPLPLINSTFSFFNMSDITNSMASLNLGANDPPRRLSQQTQRLSTHQSQNSLVVRPLHNSQVLSHLKSFLLGIWKIDNFNDIIVQEDGNLLVRFADHHRMLQVLDGCPWAFRGWYIVVDKWSNSQAPLFLQQIPLWIKILNVPEEYRHADALKEIGSVVGIPDQTRIKHPTRKNAGENWVRVVMPVTSKLRFITSMFFGENVEPTYMQLVYLKLKHFCDACGSILHVASNCDLVVRRNPIQINVNNRDQEVPQPEPNVASSQPPPGDLVDLRVPSTRPSGPQTQRLNFGPSPQKITEPQFLRQKLHT